MSTLTLKKPLSKNKKSKLAWDWLEANFVAFEKNLRPLDIGVSPKIFERARQDENLPCPKLYIRKVLNSFFSQQVYKDALINSKYRYTLDGEAVERKLDDLTRARLS